MKVHYFIRRLHLYLGAFLFPWFLMYGLSAGVLSHRYFFEKWYPDDSKIWSPVREIDYHIPMLRHPNLDMLGRRMTKGLGMDCIPSTERYSPEKITVRCSKFLTRYRLSYYPNRQRLKIEKSRFRWDLFFVSLHSRSGFGETPKFQKFWGVTVDLVSIGLLVWLATGLYMWWHLRSLRRIGVWILISGFATFIVFLLIL